MRGSLCMPWFAALSLSMPMCLSHPVHPFLMGAAGAIPLSQSLSLCSGFHPPLLPAAAAFALTPCRGSLSPSPCQQ